MNSIQDQSRVDTFRASAHKQLTGSSIPRKSEEELRRFVIDYISGNIFTSHGLTPEEVHRSFMVLSFIDWSKNPDALKDVSLIYEYYSKALPRSINGKPMFASCRLMRKGDWERCRIAINRELDRQESIEI